MDSLRIGLKDNQAGNDNFHPENSHVIPGMMRRFHEAKVAGAAEVVGFRGKIVFDSSKPDGTPPRKLLDVSLLRQLGWEASTSLRDGLKQTYHWFESHINQARQGYIPAAI